MAITRLGGANAISGTIPQGNIANASLGAVTALPAAIPTGKVLQVKSTIKTDATSTTSTSYADITGLSVAITPSASSSKIFTLFNINVSNTQLSRDDFIRLMRGSTAIVDFADEVFSTATVSADGCILYNSSASNKAIAVIDFGGTKTSTNGDFTIVFPGGSSPDSTNAIIRIA